MVEAPSISGPPAPILYGASGAANNTSSGSLFSFDLTTQSYNVLYTFSGADGSYPAGPFTFEFGLYQCNGGWEELMYGVTGEGGAHGEGTVFEYDSCTGHFTSLYSFGAISAHPNGGLVKDGSGNLYGTTQSCSSLTENPPSNCWGTVFKIEANGSFSTLISFNGTNGASPMAGLVVGSDGSFYGTTSGNGGSDHGTVFKITPDGALTILHTFSGADGAEPIAALTLGTDGNLYGTTYNGGASDGSGGGTVFKVSTDGTSFTTLYAFNPNGAGLSNPATALTQGSDGSFYGTATSSNGNAGYYGGVFEITSGAAFNVLYIFKPGSVGIDPSSSLFQSSSGSFYGGTGSGGTTSNACCGTIFALDVGP